MQARAMRMGTGSADWVEVPEAAGVVRKVGGLRRLEPSVFMVPTRARQRIREAASQIGQVRLSWSKPMQGCGGGDTKLLLPTGHQPRLLGEPGLL